MQTLPLYWLIVRNRDGAILLEKRPAKGIWGGLYCVPCFESLNGLSDFAAKLSLTMADMDEQTALTHRLTHRLLMITPFEGQMPSEHHSDGIWIKPGHLKDYGLPKPLEIYLNGNRLE